MKSVSSHANDLLGLYTHGKKIRSTFFVLAQCFKLFDFPQLGESYFIMAYISRHHFVTTRFIEVHNILFLDYGGYNMSQVNNVNFPENKLILLFLYSTEKKIWKPKTAFNERKEHPL